MVLVIDPQIAGISGDMLLCSLVDLGADKNKILDGIIKSQKFLPNSTIKEIDFTKTTKRGVEATQLKLKIDEAAHEQKGTEIKSAISDSAELIGLSSKGRSFAKSCIDTLILSESKIHGVSADSVHLHEASSVDTLVDILGTAIALEDLGIFDEEVLCMPVAVGGGSVTFSHGTMSNPAAAILEIFRNSSLKIQGNSSKSELTTPTGACILSHLSKNSIDYYPKMKIESVGYGAGQRDFDDFSNVLKIVRGTQNGLDVDSVKILETNVDDVSGEVLGGLIEKLMDKGAKDVSIYHGITKKGRPTSLVMVICDGQKVESLTDTLIHETGTLGVRVSESSRLVVPRTTHSLKVSISGKTFEVNYKKSAFKGKSNFKIEFDDLKTISNSISKSIKDTESFLRKEIEQIEDADEPS